MSSGCEGFKKCLSGLLADGEEQAVIYRMLKAVCHNKLYSGGCVPFPPLLTYPSLKHSSCSVKVFPVKGSL